MVEYKVKLEGSDGGSYVITYEGLWNNLKTAMSYDEKKGWNDVTRALRQDYNKLSDLILSELLVPKAKEAIINFLTEHPNIRTRNFYLKEWLGYKSIAWYRAQEELEAEGKIVSESHGRGQNRTWKIKES